MDGIKQGDPQQSPDCVLEKDFLFPADQPGLEVPGDVIKFVQFIRKCVVVKFVGRNYFFQRRRTFGRVPAHTRVVRASLAGTEIDATVFDGHQQGRQFSSRT